MVIQQIKNLKINTQCMLFFPVKQRMKVVHNPHHQFLRYKKHNPQLSQTFDSLVKKLLLILLYDFHIHPFL